MTSEYPAIVAALADRYGQPEPPSPAGGPVVAILAAALGRSIDPRKADALVAALADAGLLGPEDPGPLDPAELVQVARQAGVKLTDRAARLVQRLASWAWQRGDSLADAPTESLRDELRGLNGVGPAAADAVLLLGLARPTYPVDRASYRILARHGWLDPSADYDEARDAIERLDPDDPAALARLSDWLERIGRDFCRPSKARCERCPLRPFLPVGGPREPDG